MDGDPDGTIEPGTQDDRLILAERGGYYGHCNIGRGRAGYDIEWECYGNEDPRPHTVGSPAMLLESSSDGIVCYRAETFNGGAKDDLFI